MLDPNATNRESFQNASTDRQAVCSGNLIQSWRPPDKFYNGWYPVRQCSFPGHGSNIYAGSCPSKNTTVFRNYRVMCEICDHPDNQQRDTKELDECKYFCCKKSSVAPKDIKPLGTITRDPHHAQGDPCLPDTNWRFHDPRPVRLGGPVPANCKVHKRDWFRNEMEDFNAMANVKKKLAQRERMDRLNKEREIFEKLRQKHKQREQAIIDRQMSFPPLVPPPEKIRSSLLAVPTLAPKLSSTSAAPNQEVE
ncbi:unnamed protein product [Lymnaea stagnalis]|uniref:Uncharacterized protein n=1 Tax=Lymnaea stagnalis TaxID=6523 RepID=A0AAV2HXD7_LYMST